MKKAPIIFRSLLIPVVAFLFGFSALAQDPIVTIDYNATGLVSGNSIAVPVIIDGGVNIGSVTLFITYDPDYLTYNSFTADPDFVGAFGGTPTAGTVSLVWSSYPGVDCTDQLFGNINFTFNGGAGNLNFNTALCELADELATPYLSVTYNNGSYSGSFGELTSTLAGGNWGTAATWVENKAPSKAYNVNIVTNGGVVTIENNAVCNNLTINSKGKLTLSSGKSLTINGDFLLKNGSFIDLNSSNTLNATVRTYITGNWTGGQPTSSTLWHMVSSPIQNATINTFFGCLMNEWNEPASQWDSLTVPTTLPMVVGKGYAVAVNETKNYIFTGTLNTGDKLIAGLTKSGPSGSFSGANLIGNPYPSAIKWDANIVRTNVNAAAYLWSGYNYISKLTTDAIPYEIRQTQGFFVIATAGGSVGIPNSNRVHSSGFILKDIVENELTLQVNGAQYDDVTSIRFNANATEGFDGEYDAYKFWGIAEAPQLYSIVPGDYLSINSLPDLTVHPIIRLGFKAGIAGEFVINASGMDSFVEGTEMYLEDLQTGATQDLKSNATYTFTAAPGDQEHRFNLHFAPVGVGETTGSSVSIYSAGATIYINVPFEINSQVAVYDLLGKEVLSKTLAPKSLNTIATNLPDGYYVVRVTNNSGSFSSKVFLN